MCVALGTGKDRRVQPWGSLVRSAEGAGGEECCPSMFCVFRRPQRNYRETASRCTGGRRGGPRGENAGGDGRDAKADWRTDNAHGEYLSGYVARGGMQQYHARPGQQQQHEKERWW